MLPQRLLTLRGSALLSGLWKDRGGGGGQEAGITEVTPLSSVEHKDWEGRMLSACDWSTPAWLISLSGCLVPSALVLACNPSLSDNILLCFLPEGSSLFFCLWMGVFAQSNAKMFWIASSELPQSYFRLFSYYYDGAVQLLSQLPNDAFFVCISFLP